MARREIVTYVWVCERCGHEWPPRDKTQEPRVCPKCKSPYWNTPRRREATGIAAVNKKAAGR